LTRVPRRFSRTFERFVDSEKSIGLLLIACTLISLLIANSQAAAGYVAWWQTPVAGLSLQHWANDALMAIFFLLIGLELERELYSGELSNARNAMLPMFAAMGGVIAPAAIHFSLNAGAETQPGIGIPIATDIAFALGALAILGTRVPASLKVFVVAFAVVDDLTAIVVIAVFYTQQLSLEFLLAAIGVWVALCALNRVMRVMRLAPYLVGGALMWILMLKAGVHPTVAGVMLAFAIPFSSRGEDTGSPSHKLENALHKPVAFIVLPIFALANSAIPVPADWMHHMTASNSLGIVAGLVIGKPLGIATACVVAVFSGLCRLPADTHWGHLVGAAILGGIGFTMSIFIANLAFAGNLEAITTSKMAILLASLAAGLLGISWLFAVHRIDARRHLKGNRLSSR
jgi:NhaA family Na+:H+ antiporter